MKKITGFLLAVVMLLSSVCLNVAFAQNDNMDTSDMRVDALIELGILDSYTPEADVSKEMVYKALTNLTGSNALSIKFLGENYKNEAITPGQFIPIMIDMAGYTNYVAASMGGYSEYNCKVIANKIGITKGLSVYEERTLKMKEFVRILSNTLFKVDVMKPTMSSTAQTYEVIKDKKVINDIRGIVWVEGTLKGMGKINMTTMAELSDFGIRIENQEYAYKEVTDPENYIGRYVRAYMDEEEPFNVLALETVDRKNNVITFESDDVEVQDVSDTQISYEDENGKIKNIKLSQTLNVVYNGEFVPFYNRDDFLAQDAYFTLIDVGDDRIYDTMIIDK